MTIDVATIVTISSVVGAVLVIYKFFGKIHTWVEHQNEQDAKCKHVQEEQNRKIEETQEETKQEIQHMKEEQCLIVYATLACLKGLQQMGCNGEVTQAIGAIEKHLNKQAHDVD